MSRSSASKNPKKAVAKAFRKKLYLFITSENGDAKVGSIPLSLGGAMGIQWSGNKKKGTKYENFYYWPQVRLGGPDPTVLVQYALEHDLLPDTEGERKFGPMIAKDPKAFRKDGSVVPATVYLPVTNSKSGMEAGKLIWPKPDSDNYMIPQYSIRNNEGGEDEDDESESDLVINEVENGERTPADYMVYEKERKHNIDKKKKAQRKEKSNLDDLAFRMLSMSGTSKKGGKKSTKKGTRAPREIPTFQDKLDALVKKQKESGEKKYFNVSEYRQESFKGGRIRNTVAGTVISDPDHPDVVFSLDSALHKAKGNNPRKLRLGDAGPINWFRHVTGSTGEEGTEEEKRARKLLQNAVDKGIKPVNKKKKSSSKKSSSKKSKKPKKSSSSDEESD